MKNRNVGLMIVGISVLVGFIIYLFNRALTSMIKQACSHGSECPMWDTLNLQTNIGLGIMVFIILIGLYLVFFAKEAETAPVKQIKPKKISKQQYKKVLEELKPDEKKVFNILLDSEGSVFQSDVVAKTGFSKVKVTRLLDRLEGKKLIERKRRGMTNIVLLKE